MNEAGTPHITQEDLDALNRRALIRSAHVVRQAARVLLVVAAVLVLAWLWNTVRSQQQLNGYDSFIIADAGLTADAGSPDVTWTQRVDAAVGYLVLLAYAALTAGLGLALRLYAEATIVREGADITPWQLGDRIDDEDADA